MRIYFFLFGAFCGTAAYAVTSKDLPKYPESVKINRVPVSPPVEKEENEDVILRSLRRYSLNRDMNLIPWPNYDPDADPESNSSSPSSPTLEGEQEENSISQSNETIDLAPGLKSHKKKLPPPAEDTPSPPPILLKGIVLFGDTCLVGTKDLTLFSGFTTVGLPDQLQDAALGRKLQPLYCGKEFNEENVDKIKEFIQNYYLQNEIGIVSVSIPIQDITTQVLSVVVQVAKIDQIYVHGNRYTDSETIIHELGLQTNQAVHLKNLDQREAFFNLNPFQKADVYFSNADLPGKVNAQVMTGDRFPLRVYAGADNRGLELIGPIRSYYGANLAQLFSISDIISFQYTASLDFSAYQSFTGEYVAFFYPNLIFKAYGGYVSLTYEQQDIVVNQGYSGQFSLQFDLPWYLSNAIDFRFGIGIDYKNTNTNIEYVEYDPTFANSTALTQLIGKITTNWLYKRFHGGINVYGVLSLGNLFGNATENRYEALRLGSSPYYSYAKADLDCYIPIGVFGDFHLVGRGQYASKNLLPSEEFPIGGLTTVRGYIESAAVGDIGYQGSLEWLFPSFSILRPRKDRTGNLIEDGLTLGAFVDYGQIFVKNFYTENQLVQPKRAHLYSVGPKVVYKLADYIYAELNAGFKLKQTYLDPTSGCKINFNAIVKF
jgi:hemolysin activation/secretion protein